MSAMTCEKAEGVLRGQGVAGAEAQAVAEAPDFWICKFSEAGKDGYRFAQVWGNEDPSGGISYAAHVMDEKDMRALGGLQMRLVDLA